MWNLRSSDEGEGEQGTTGLQVTPLEVDVPEGASLSFRVEVSPTKGNCYFAEEAEAFVSPSNQMTFRYERSQTTHKEFEPFDWYTAVAGSREGGFKT